MMAIPATASCILIWLTTLATIGHSADLDTDKHALLSFQKGADLSHVLDGNWTMGTNPCTDSWTGVSCDHPATNRVTRLKLQSQNLTGSIPLGSLGQLDELRVLRLSDNRLTGSIPNDLPKCTKLKKLLLGTNNFSGPIPDFFSGWQFLDRLDLSRNFFSGRIPGSISSLKKQLLTLRLEFNSLEGHVLDVTEFSVLDDFNVSWNNLAGRIPKRMARFGASSFLGNAGLCGRPLSLECPRHGFYVGSKFFVIFMALLVWVVLSGLLAWGCLYKSRMSRTRRDDAEQHLAAQKSSTASDLVFVQDMEEHDNFELLDLLRASAYLLGKGTSGSTFKSVLENGVVVAVKRLLDRTSCDRKVFERRMQVVGRLMHPNLLPIRAYYFYSRQEKVLVHDYMPNGSLAALLASRGATLEWGTRLGIARGMADCLLFLHQQCKLVHGNIKPSNILLDENYHPRLSDFGLWTFAGSVQERHEVYRAPEHKVSRKSDIYSYGMVLFELLTGKLPARDSGPNWAMLAMKDEWGSSGISPAAKEQMLLVCRLATLCTSNAADQRPKAMQVNHMMRQADSWSDYTSSPTSNTGLL